MRQTGFLLLVILVVACSPVATPTASQVPTAYPPEYLPTVIALTAESASVFGTQVALSLTPSVSPSDTPSPTLSPTPRPTLTATTIPGHEPGAIQITAPGPMSKVVSPITLRMHITAGESGKAQIDLYGEDGGLLARIVKRVPPSGKGVDQQVKIPFEIRAAAEIGRITVSTQDKAGRVQALNSVRLLLLSAGTNEINPAGNLSEPVGVFSPSPDATVSGGVLDVKGDIWPFNLNPVIFELLGPDGKSMGLRIVNVSGLNPQLFETTLPYKVSDPTAALLTIRQDDDRLSGMFYMYSQPVLLNP